MFDLDQFIADLRAALGERSRQALKEVVARAVADPASLLRQIGEPDKAAVQVLHQAPDLTVLNVIWAPKQVTLPHDHRMSAVIGMYGGREDNTFWRRVANPTKFQIEPAGGQALGTGDVTLLGRDVVHSVVNPLAKISGAIHVYDGEFLAVQRSMWDAETLMEKPYDVNAVANRHAVAERAVGDYKPTAPRLDWLASIIGVGVVRGRWSRAAGDGPGPASALTMTAGNGRRRGARLQREGGNDYGL